MTTSMMYLWLRNQLLQTVPIVLILPDWQDINFIHTVNSYLLPMPPPPIITMLQSKQSSNLANSPFALQET